MSQMCINIGTETLFCKLLAYLPAVFMLLIDIGVIAFIIYDRKKENKGEEK